LLPWPRPRLRSSATVNGQPSFSNGIRACITTPSCTDCCRRPCALLSRHADGHLLLQPRLQRRTDALRLEGPTSTRKRCSRPDSGWISSMRRRSPEALANYLSAGLLGLVGRTLTSMHGLVGKLVLTLSITRVNSKATLKVSLDALLQYIPTALHAEIRASRYVAERASALIIQADDSRKQNDNAHNCYRRLHEAIVDAGRHAIPGETSAEQAERVKNLCVDRALSRPVLTTNRQKSENERRLKSKKTHSAKKSSRRGRGDD
jgi:hypothetical protein